MSTATTNEPKPKKRNYKKTQTKTFQREIDNLKLLNRLLEDKVNELKWQLRTLADMTGFDLPTIRRKTK